MGKIASKNYIVYIGILQAIISNTPKYSVKQNLLKNKITGDSLDDQDARLRRATKAIFGEEYVRSVRGPKPKDDDGLVDLVHRDIYILKKSKNFSSNIRLHAKEQIKNLSEIQEKSFIKRITRKVRNLEKDKQANNESPFFQFLLKGLTDGNATDFNSFTEEQIKEQVSCIFQCLEKNNWLERRYLNSDIINNFCRKMDINI